jgi:replication factor C large subunit
MIALADLNLGRAFRTQNYTYWKYAFLFMGRGVAAAKRQTYKKFARYTNSTVYARLSKSRKRKNLIEAVTTKMSKKLHTSPKELEKQLPYYTVLFEDNEEAYDLKEYFKLEDEEVKLFRSRKIPASVEKNRIKQLQKKQKEEEKAIQKAKKEAQKKAKDKTTKKAQSSKTTGIVKEDNLEDKPIKTNSEPKLDDVTESKKQKEVDEKTSNKESSRENNKTTKVSSTESTEKTTKEEKGDEKSSKKDKPKSKQTTLFDF